MPTSFTQSERVDELLGALQKLRAQDRIVEGEAKKFSGKASLWYLGTALSFGVAIVGTFATGQSAIAVIGGVAAVVCLIFGIINSTTASSFKKQDIEDRRIELPVRLLEILGDDVPKKAKCTLDINFEGYQTHGQLVEKIGGGFFNATTETKYSDPWFSAKGSLYDGNIFRARIVQMALRKEIRKRKYTKIQEKFHEEISLLVKLSAESYPNRAQLPQLLQPGVYDGLDIARVDVQGDVVRVKARSGRFIQTTGRMGTQSTGQENSTSGDTLLKLFVYVYSQIQKCAPQSPGNAPA